MAQGNVSYFRLGRLGLEPCTLEEHIQVCLRNCLLTQMGELPHAPQLGSRLFEFIFRPLTHILRQEIEREVRRALSTGEPRIEVTQVSVTSPGKDRSHVLIQIAYCIKETQKVDRLRFSLLPEGTLSFRQGVR